MSIEPEIKKRMNEWNKNHPNVGAEVKAKLRNGQTVLTRTLGPAYAFGDTAFIKLENLGDHLFSNVQDLK